MKKIGVVLGCVLTISFIVYALNGRGEVQIVKEAESAMCAETMLLDMSNLKNLNGVDIIVDEVDYTTNQRKVYISNRLRIMVPLDFFTDVMDASVTRYQDGQINIAKGDNRIVLTQDSLAGTANDEVIALGDKVTLIEDQIYVPINNIAPYLDYNFKYNISEGVVAMKKLSMDYLPSKYDMRDSDRVTPVKDQGRYGTCWAFVSLSALETTIMPYENMTFSVDHMSLNNDFNLSVNDGGDYTMAIAYLASWKGPVLEKDDPYGDGESNPNLKSVKHLEEALIIESKDYKSIKNAVFKYGAVETAIYTKLTGASSYSSYYNRDRSTYYFDGEADPNHDVLIVGWDDDFPKEYFTNGPEGDGAFICKNSWGTEFGENGYFYVSYYDTIIGTTNVVYSKVGNEDNFDNIYQSDLLGWIGQLGYNSEYGYFANVYTAEADENLVAAGFYATGPDTDYEIYIIEDYKNVDSLDSANRQLVAEGHLSYSGYYTIDFDKTVLLDEGEKYAVMVYVKTPGAIHPVAIEYEADNRSSTVDISDGLGYISLYGQVWTNTEKTQNCNVCLKAFTNDR